jgi:membrane protein
LEQRDRGRRADWPSEFGAVAWKDIGWRVWSEVNEDRVMLIAAGVTFYLLLALFPALAAFVSLYGFVADPVTIADQVSYLAGLLPNAGLEIIEQQLIIIQRKQYLEEVHGGTMARSAQQLQASRLPATRRSGLLGK